MFAEHLYAAVRNPWRGYQLWKAADLGGGRLRWTRVLDRGAGRGAAAPAVASAHVFEGALYLGVGRAGGVVPYVVREGRDVGGRHGPSIPTSPRMDDDEDVIRSGRWSDPFV